MAEEEKVVESQPGSNINTILNATMPQNEAIKYSVLISRNDVLDALQQYNFKVIKGFEYRAGLAVIKSRLLRLLLEMEATMISKGMNVKCYYDDLESSDTGDELLQLFKKLNLLLDEWKIVSLFGDGILL